jgi:ubiquinone/menaquinone biosynthesis C-methylase UbiE
MPHDVSSPAHAAEQPVDNQTPSPGATEGPLVHDAVEYDRRVRSMTLGHQQQFRQQMADLLQLHEGDVVLDVGCGTGDLSFEAAKRVGSTGRVVGVDGSEEMIARARQKARRRHLSIDFQVQLAEALSFPSHCFDWVVSSLVFHALPGMLKLQTLGAIAQVLKAGGCLLIIDFLDPSGFVLTHSAKTADQHDLPSMLRHVGFEPVQSGPFPFKTAGIPPLGYVSALPPHRQ